MSERKVRVLYAGSPLASSIVLKALLDESSHAALPSADDSCGYEIVGVLTNPPSAQGRHKELIPTDVAKLASQFSIPVFTPEHLDTAAREAIAPVHADILVCFDYGRIFGPKFLALFPLGGINLHPSALPKYRGCTPVPAAILAGDKTLGISVQKLALKTDEGDLLAQTTIALDGTETTGSLMDGDGTHSAVTDAGIAMLKKILRETAHSCTAGESGSPFTLPAAAPQSGESSYTPFIKKEDGAINWTHTADEIDRQIRAYTPWPGCYTTSGGVQLRILAAHPARVSTPGTSAAPGTVLPYDKSVGVQIACGGGTVLIATELQWQAKKAMMYKDFMNGARGFTGTVLG